MGKPNTITITFLTHDVKVDAMELRAKVSDLECHMSRDWTFCQGSMISSMRFPFARTAPCTGRLPIECGSEYTNVVQWTFPGDFCLEHIVLYGNVCSGDKRLAVCSEL